MSDFTELGYLSLVCLGITVAFHLKGVAYYTTTGRAAAARNILLTIILGIYLYKHAIVVLGVAFFALGYTAIATESNNSTPEVEPKPTIRVRGIPNKTATRRTTVKKLPLRKTVIKRTPVRRNTSGSFQPATRFSIPPTIFNASPRREHILTQQARENFEAFKREIEEKYGPTIEGPIPRQYRS